MTKIRRAYRAVARAYKLHIPAPQWAIDLLEEKTKETEENIVKNLTTLQGGKCGHM